MKYAILLMFFAISVFAKLDELSKQPEITDLGNVIYPEKLKNDKKEGEVRIFIDVTKDGTMKMYGVLKSTDVEFEKALAKEIKKFKFSPAEYKNKPIAVRITYKYKFSLDGSLNKTIGDVSANKDYNTEKKEIDSIIVKDEATTTATTEVVVQKDESKKEAVTSDAVQTEVITTGLNPLKETTTEAKKDEVKTETTTATTEVVVQKDESKKEAVTSDAVQTEVITTGLNPLKETTTEVKKDEVKTETTTATTEVKSDAVQTEVKTDEVKTDTAKTDEVPTLSKNPELIKFVEAVYPEDLRKEKIQGNVTFFIDIDENGKIINLGVINSTDEKFNQAATEAVKQFEFTPGEYEGNPVPVRITYQYNFVIKEEVQATKEEIEKAKEEKTVIVEQVDYDSVKGKIISYGTREPVANALVFAIDKDQNSFETMTDQNGNYLFKNLKDGSYIIVVPEKDRFLRFETTEEIKKGELVNLAIYLPKDNLNPYELTVISQKGKKEVTKQVIKVEELLKIPGTSGDAIKVVQNLPGVSRAGGLSGQIIIRGSNNRESQIFVDGFNVPILFHFGGLTSVYNSELLKDVSYYPGGYSVQYGRALGGIIDVKTKDIATTKESQNIHGYFDVDLIDSSAMVEVPIDEDSGFAIAARRSYIDFILPFVLPDSVSDIIIALPVYYDWQAQYNINLTKKDKLSFALYGSKDSLELFFDKPQGDPNFSGNLSFTTYFSTIKSNWEHNFSKTLKSDMGLGIQFSGRDIEISELVKFKLDVWTITLKENIEHTLNKYITFNYGLDFYSQIYSADITAPVVAGGGQSNSDDFQPIGSYKVQNQKADGTTYLPALYTEMIITYDKFKFVPGLRFDYTSNTNLITVDPRFGAFYTFNDKLLFKGSVGAFHQPPGVDQTDSFIGNPETQSQYSIQYSIGTEYRFTDFINASLEFFYNDQRDLIVGSNEKVIIDDEIVTEQLNNDGRGRAYGMEVFLRHNMSAKFFGWISYTLMKAERKDHSWEEWEPFQFDQTHILTMVGSYKLPYGFEVGARLRYVTGSPETPVIGSVYDADSNDYAAIYGEPNSERNDPFFQLDLRIDKTWQFKLWTLTAYLDVQNVTYYKNQEGVSYNYDYSESQKVEGLPIFPSFGIKGSF